MHVSATQGSRSSSTGRSARGGLWRAIRLLTHYRWLALLAYISLIIASLSTLLIPLLARLVIDRGLNPENPADSDEALVIRLALLMVGLAVIGGLFTFLQNYLGERAGQWVAYDLRNSLYEKIQTLSFSYHDRAQTGQLMTRATSDVEQLRLFIGQGILQALNAVLLLIGIAVILVALNWQLTLAVFPALFLMSLLFAVFGKKIRPLFRAVQEYLAALNTILQENLNGIRVVKAFSREDYEQQRFTTANFALRDANLNTTRALATVFPAAFLIAGVSLVVVVWAGGYLVVKSTLELGELTAFSTYLALMLIPVAQLGFIIASAGQAAASATRIFDILDAENDIQDSPNAQPLDDIQGHIEFENVSFRYFKSGAAILSDVSFSIEPGQRLALLGATGSGKSTIINLIPRFYDPTQGCIKIDGVESRSVTLESLRRQIGIVLQETRLFSGTIRDNIAYGRSDATQADIEAAAKAAVAHDFILEFPNGYATLVGERGVNLSGGQKQRIAIARALLLNPRILILDDSTSSVDVQTESHIQAALDQLMQNRTSLVIAQRISTVLNADKILVLEEGHVAAMGTHTELLESSPAYAEIYHSQLVEDRPDAEPVFSAELTEEARP